MYTTIYHHLYISMHFTLQLTIFFLSVIFTHSVFAAVEDTAIEQADTARSINAMEINPPGAWIPVPIPVSNPTIGTGLQAALLYLHPKAIEGDDVPNATSGILGMYTDTESWLTGAFHDGNLYNDQYRFRMFVATGEFNLDFYGIGSDSILRNNPIPYNITSDVLYSQLLREYPGGTDWYFGLRYMYSNSNLSFGNAYPSLPPISSNMITSSLGLMTTHDNRDDNYYPTTGANFELVFMRDSEDWGSDFDFDKIELDYSHYFTLTSKNVLAMKIDFAKASGNIPFYLLPTLNMRGFPIGLYKNKTSLSTHAEWRHKLNSRWGFIMFYETGSTADSSNDLFDIQTINAYGGGIRWQVTKDKKLNLGIDVGYSDDNSAIYVQVGEKF